MTLKQKRILWFLLWLLVIFSGPVTVFINTPPALIFSDYLILINAFQRITGLLAFSLLFIQIVLGSFMNKWIQILGGGAYKVHITQGLITYGFVFLHPIFEVVLRWELGGVDGLVSVFLPNYFLQREIYLTFGKIAFVLLTIAVVAAYFRTKPFFRRNWRAFHILNYLSFVLVIVHSRNVGTDVRTPPFSWFYTFTLIVFPIIVFYRFVYPFLKGRFGVGPVTKHAR